MTDREEIYSGRLIKLYREHVELPGGGVALLDIVRHPGGAVIAPLNEDNEICLLKQFRHAAGGVIWEMPAGCIDPGEMPLQTAKRELREETGLIANSWTALGHILSTPGFCDEVLHLYLARDLVADNTSHGRDEIIEVHWLPVDMAMAMAHKGEISDAKTLALLFRLQPHLNPNADVTESLRPVGDSG